MPDAATEGTAVAKARKDRILEKRWEIMFNTYQDKIEKFDGLWIKAYALIWNSYCSKEIQVVLKEMPGFDKIINKDPIVLLKRIE